MRKQPMTAWWSATNKTMKRFSFIAAVLLCFVTMASAAIRPAQPGIGGGSGSGSQTTGSVTVLAPLVLSGTEIQLPQRISQLNTNYPFTNASSRDFYATNGNLYSKNLSLNHRWVYYDDFNQPMTTPGVFPDSPTGHKYNVFTGGGGNTNKINLVDGKWWLGETGAVYQSVTFGTNGVYGSAAPINTWGGTFSYQRSTNSTPDGYEQNLFFILSPQVDFLPTNYLHITIGANIFRVQRELSSTNIIYAQHFGGRYLAFDTNHSFTVTIISNNIICDIAGMRYVGYDESLSTTYGNIKVATWEAIGSPTNQFWGKWDSQYAGYADNEAHWQYAGPFGVRSNGTLQKITFNDQAESRYQLKHESDLFQLYDAISGEILFSADDTAQVVTVGGASAGTVNIIRPLIYTSGTPGTGKVLTDTDGSGTAVWQTPSAGAQTPWAQDINGATYNLTNVGSITQVGDGVTPSSISLYETNGTKYSQLIAPNQIQTNNVLRLPTNDISGVVVAHAISEGTNQLANIQLKIGQYVTHNGLGYVAANETYTGATNETWLNLDFNPANVTNTYIITTSATNFTVSATNLYQLASPREISLVFPTNAASFVLWFTNANGITHKWMNATNATKTNTYHREVIIYASRTNEASVYQADNR